MGTWELGSEEGQPGNFKSLSSLKSPDVKSPRPLLEKEPREGGKEGRRSTREKNAGKMKQAIRKTPDGEKYERHY